MNVKLNGAYVNTHGTKITLIREYMPEDADYAQGFRFRGDDGRSYTETGSPIGHIGGAEVIMAGAYPLVAEWVEPLVIELGQFYRNGLRSVREQVVMIVDEVSEDSPYYASGFRYVDNRGSYYKPNGVTADRGIYARLNLVEHLRPEELTEMQMCQNKIWDTQYIKHLDTIKRRRELTRNTKRIGRKIGRLAAGMFVGASFIVGMG